MFYGRAEFGSFEIISPQSDQGVIAKTVIEVAGLGKASSIIEASDQDEICKDATLLIISNQRLDNLSPELFLTVQNPDFEVRSLGSGRFWVGFDEGYDSELIGMIKEEVFERLQVS